MNLRAEAAPVRGLCALIIWKVRIWPHRFEHSPRRYAVFCVQRL